MIKNDAHDIIIRPMQVADIGDFGEVARWKRYYQEDQQGIRTVCIVVQGRSSIGYGSLVRRSEYPHFRDENIPEVHDVWIAPEHRTKGYGRALIEHLETMARKEGYACIGIGVGLHAEYGPAQKLYVRLGYIPDGRGITSHYRSVVPGNTYSVDDDLILWLTKAL